MSLKSSPSLFRIAVMTSVVSITVALSSCATSPLGRHQLLLMPDDQMDEMGITAYQQIKTEQSISQNGTTNNYVNCVTNALIGALEKRGNWEVNVFVDPSANAFALPGGKIGVNSGLLDVAQNADQLAAVIGHEIGHVQAKHGNERMSIKTATETSMQMLQALSGEASPEKEQLFGLLGLGSEVGVSLPFSRKHEAEADIIGLKIMANAGFDPRESISLWQNMAKAGGAAQPEFLSTHPANSTRINGLQHHMGEAMALYSAAQSSGKSPQCRR